MPKCLKGWCGTRKRRSSSRSSSRSSNRSSNRSNRSNRSKRIVGGPPISRTKNARFMHDPYPTGAHVNFKPQKKKTKSAMKKRSRNRSNNRS